MRPEEFVFAVKNEVVEGNTRLYAELLSSTDRGEVKDGYWREVLAFYDSLDERGKKALLSIMRQVCVDAVSNLFGILDGSSYLGGVKEDFALLDSRHNRLNGNLQDLFLEEEERS